MRASHPDQELIVLGVVAASGDAGRDAHSARQLRRGIGTAVRKAGLYGERTIVRTAPSFAAGVRAAVRSAPASFLVVGWPGQSGAKDDADLASSPPCDAAFLRSGEAGDWRRVLVAARGGPQAELALELALSIGHRYGADITLMHVERPSSGEQARQREHRLFQSLLARCRDYPRLHLHTVSTEEVSETIVKESQRFDLLVLGAALASGQPGEGLGEVPERVAAEASCTTVVVKAGTPPDPAIFQAPAPSINVLVDRWFADNTFHCREFSDIGLLVKAKRRARLTVSLAVMASEDRGALPNIVETLRAELQERHALLDELVVFDQEGVPLSSATEAPATLSRNGRGPAGARPGRAIWNSLGHLKGDIVAWLEGDIRNIHPRMVYGVVGPLLTHDGLQYVKGFYQRPETANDADFGDGRMQITELTARPLLNLFFPELSGVVEPLSREHAIRRSAVEQMPIFAGRGVEVGLLIDAFSRLGLRSIAQSDLESRVGHDLSLNEVTAQAFSVIQVIMKRLGERHDLHLLSFGQPSMKLILQRDEKYHLELVEAAEDELPPVAQSVISIP
ncbi:MAG: universal stress protein [Dehalococcoidia bacterium]